jgi:ribosomal protein S18 acetylase RimI-like enzyme
MQVRALASTESRIYVRAGWQERGVGGALMKAALAHPRVAPGATVFLDVWEDNHRAQAFYRRHGFEPVGKRELMLANGPADGLDLVMARGPRSRISPSPPGS